MGGAEYPAKVLGYDEDRDVAVLQLVYGDGEPVSTAAHARQTLMHIILLPLQNLQPAGLEYTDSNPHATTAEAMDHKPDVQLHSNCAGPWSVQSLPSARRMLGIWHSHA